MENKKATVALKNGWRLEIERFKTKKPTADSWYGSLDKDMGIGADTQLSILKLLAETIDDLGLLPNIKDWLVCDDAIIQIIERTFIPHSKKIIIGIYIDSM